MTEIRIEVLPTCPLTRREREVLEHTANGLDQNQIAEKLYRSRRTIEHHTENIKEKLRANTLAQAVAIAWANGWLKARKTLCWLLVAGLLAQADQPGVVARSSRTSRVPGRPAPTRPREL